MRHLPLPAIEHEFGAVAGDAYESADDARQAGEVLDLTAGNINPRQAAAFTALFRALREGRFAHGAADKHIALVEATEAARELYRLEHVEDERTYGLARPLIERDREADLRIIARTEALLATKVVCIGCSSAPCACGGAA